MDTSSVGNYFRGLLSQSIWAPHSLTIWVPANRTALQIAIVGLAIAITIICAILFWVLTPKLNAFKVCIYEDELSEDNDAEIRLATSKQPRFRRAFGERTISGDFRTVSLVVRPPGKWRARSSRAVVKLNRECDPADAIWVNKTLADSLDFDVSNINDDPIGVKMAVLPGSFYASTFGSGDPAVSSAWIVGAALGLFFLIVAKLVDVVFS